MALALRVLLSTDLASLPSGSGGQETVLDNGATRGWLVKSICLNNTQAAAITGDLYVSKAGGTNTYLYKAYSVGASSQLLIEKDITLNHTGTADALKIKC